MSRFRRASIAAVLTAGFATAVSVAAAANSGAHWVLDPRTGCYIYDPDALPTYTASWSGDCADRRATGTGAVVFSARDRFVASVSGTFANGLANGAVRIGWADGAHFEGHAVLGRIAGDGSLTTASGDRFDGVWKGSRDGEGTVAWANGDRYQGAWVEGLPSGSGVLIRKDGSRFEGEFVAGEPKSPAATAAAPAPAASGATASKATASATASSASAAVVPSAS